MSTTLRVLVLLFLCSPLASQQPSAQQPKKGNITGTVIDRVTAQPVRKAKVTLYALQADPAAQLEADDKHLMTVTDEQGTFKLEDIQQGKYVLMANRIGYLEFGRPRVFATLTAGQDLSGIVLRLTPACAISGRVLDEQGDPLVGVQVQVSKRRNAGNISARRGGHGQVDDHGEFRVFDLAPGKYYLSVRAWRTPELPSKQGNPSDWRYPVTYYPGVTSAEAATGIEARPGEEPRVELVVAPVRAVRVRGRVLGTRPADSDTQTTVMLSSDNFGGTNVRVKPDGSFEIPGVLPGKYTLTTFVGSGGEKEIMSAQRSILVGEEGLDNVELTLKPVSLKAELHGIVRPEGPVGPGLDHLSVMLYETGQADENSGLTFFLPHGGAMMAWSGQNLSGQVKKDGTFTIKSEGVHLEKVMPMLMAGGGYEDFYTKTVHYGGQDVTNTGFTPGADGLLELVIASDGGRVEGAVVDQNQKPADGAVVVAVPATALRKRRELFTRANADLNGHFTLRGIKPGDYKLFAWDSSDITDYTDPEFLKTYEDLGQPLHVDANSRNSVALKLIEITDE